jgi:hypothetical protein
MDLMAYFFLLPYYYTYDRDLNRNIDNKSSMDLLVYFLNPGSGPKIWCNGTQLEQILGSQPASQPAIQPAGNRNAIS